MIEVKHEINQISDLNINMVIITCSQWRSGGAPVVTEGITEQDTISRNYQVSCSYHRVVIISSYITTLHSVLTYKNYHKDEPVSKFPSYPKL